MTALDFGYINRSWVIEEEAQHLFGGIRAARIGVGPGRAAAGPGVACAMDEPLLDQRLPARVDVPRANVGMTVGHVSLFYLCLEGHCERRLGDDVITVAGVHSGIAVAMKHDCGDNAPPSVDVRPNGSSWMVPVLALPHCRESRRQIASRPAG